MQGRKWVNFSEYDQVLLRRKKYILKVKQQKPWQYDEYKMAKFLNIYISNFI